MKFWISNANRRGLVVISILILGGTAVYFLTKSTKTTRHPLVELPSRPESPDYRGVRVERLIRYDEILGKGKIAAEGDDLKIEQGIWIYDPGAPANRGKLLSKSDKELKVIRSSKSKGARGEIKDLEILRQAILGMREGGTRRLILPAHLYQNEDEIRIQLKPELILQITVTLLQVKSGK